MTRGKDPNPATGPPSPRVSHHHVPLECAIASLSLSSLPTAQLPSPPYPLMIPLHRTLTRSPSTPLLSLSPPPPPALATSASFNHTATQDNTRFHVVSQYQVAHIAYFSGSASGSPKLGMNTNVRFVRPGCPSAALDVFAAHTEVPMIHCPTKPGIVLASQPVEPPSLERFRFTALQDRANIPSKGKPASDKQARNRLALDLKKLKHRTSLLSNKFGLASRLDRLRARSPRVFSDPELAFQNEQHRKHICWRCRKAGSRQKACRAFRRPVILNGQMLPLDPVAVYTGVMVTSVL